MKNKHYCKCEIIKDFIEESEKKNKEQFINNLEKDINTYLDGYINIEHFDDIALLLYSKLPWVIIDKITELYTSKKVS